MAREGTALPSRRRTEEERIVQITRETDYAIRCVYYLSDKGGAVTMVDEISREMSIPKSFLAKILQKLSKAAIVKSYRGVKGGFEIARDPAEITLLDVIEAVQGPVAMNICALDEALCGSSATCTIHPVWIEVRREVEKLLREKNFSSLRLQEKLK
jgi:Rrf2 family protein